MRRYVFVINRVRFDSVAFLNLFRICLVWNEVMIMNCSFIRFILVLIFLLSSLGSFVTIRLISICICLLKLSLRRFSSVECLNVIRLRYLLWNTFDQENLRRSFTSREGISSFCGSVYLVMPSKYQSMTIHITLITFLET